MTRQPVKSSAIASIGHEGEVLEVAFKSGHIYRYPGVSRELYAELLAADSLGRALQQRVIGAGIKHVRVEPEATS